MKSKRKLKEKRGKMKIEAYLSKIYEHSKKRVLKSEVIVIQAYLKKENLKKNLTSYLKELEKEQSPNLTEEIK